MGSLHDFCLQLAREYDPRNGLHPERVGERFREYFGLPHRPSKEDLVDVLEGSGVGTVRGSRLPQGLRGVHFSAPGGGYDVHYSVEQWRGAQEHTLLHETYEIIHETLADMFGNCPTSAALCADADKFAAVTMMSGDLFHAVARASGLDVVEIQRQYGRSYSSVAMRLAEVMKEQPMFIALYERRANGGPLSWPDRPMPGAIRVTVVRRTEGFGARRDHLLYGARGGQPIRGALARPGSLAYRVIESGRPSYAESRRNPEPHGNPPPDYPIPQRPIAVAARPVIWHGRVAKVAVVAVPLEDRAVFWPQLERAKFELLLTAP